MRMIFLQEDTKIIGSSGLARGVMDYLSVSRARPSSPAHISKKYELGSLARILPTFNKVLTKLHILILLVLSVSVYWNSLDGDFVHDDLPTIVNNKDVTGGNPWTSVWTNDFWGTNIRDRRSHKSYRPLTIITFRLTVWMFGLSPRAFHLTNLALHCLVVFIFRNKIPESDS